MGKGRLIFMSEKINELINEIFNKIYPVGSIYISNNNTNPSNYFGGTWIQIKDTFLLGAGDIYANGSTGGEATHTLTLSEMASHAHSAGRYDGYRIEFKRMKTGNSYNGVSISDTKTGMTTRIATNATGENATHNNMPPYLAVYVWKRVALSAESFVRTNTQPYNSYIVVHTITYINYNTKYIKDVNNNTVESPIGEGTVNVGYPRTAQTLYIFNDSACTDLYTTITLEVN